MADRRKKQDPALDFEIGFYEGIIRRSPSYVEALIPLAEAYTRKGYYQKGLEIDKRLASLCCDDPVVFYNLACSCALVGQTSEAFEALKKAVLLGYQDLEHLRKDPDLQSLQSYPAFQEWFSGL